MSFRQRPRRANTRPNRFATFGDLLPQGSSTNGTEMDGEQIPRISPGFMADVHAPFLHESAICHFEEI
jgi:hypothetical protein